MSTPSLADVYRQPPGVDHVLWTSHRERLIEITYLSPELNTDRQSKRQRVPQTGDESEETRVASAPGSTIQPSLPSIRRTMTDSEEFLKSSSLLTIILEMMPFRLTPIANSGEK